MPSKRNSAVTRSTTTVSGGLSSGQTFNDDARLATVTHPSPLPIQVTSPNEPVSDALVSDSSAQVRENAILVDQVKSSEETAVAPSMTSVAISIMATTAASSVTPVLVPDATTEPDDDTGTPTPPPTPLIVWNKMPSNDPSCLGTGYFPFDRGSTEDPPQYVVHDIELRGRVTTCNILA